MQFKHPEILYFLLALIIPILVHLFQLQKFKKVVFTNVSFLKKIELQTRKSSQLKKWLILATRMLLFTGLIFAFSQPYFSSKKSSEQVHHFIYLDNSLSLNAIGKKGKLLQISAQEIIENLSDEDTYSLMTNSDFYGNLSASELKNQLKKIKFSSKTQSIAEILLKTDLKNGNLTNRLNNIILISDFQNINKNKNNQFTNVTSSVSLVKVSPEQKTNLSIDSIFVSDKSEQSFTLQIAIKNQGPKKENVPISIFNDETLITKRSFSIESDAQKILDFEIQNQSKFKGQIKIQNSDVFLFDNDFFFTINFDEKINVLSIGENSSFLKAIFTEDTFNFEETSKSKINYNSIPKQQLIILNELDAIPPSLSNALSEFVKIGGSLTVIPSTTSVIPSYNAFLKSINIGSIVRNRLDSLKITKIHFDDPLFKDVFTKKVENFQFPVVGSSFLSNIRGTALLSFENAETFLSKSNVQSGQVYWFSAPINRNNSNFTNSPLIVPTFYNIGMNSLQVSRPYYLLQETNTIELNEIIGKDQVVSIRGNNTSFIPFQQNSQNKISLKTEDRPELRGFYHVVNKDTLQTIAYNNPTSESVLNYLDIESIANTNEQITTFDNIAEYFYDQQQKNEVQWLWKLFLALAIVSLLLEILILKFFRT